MLSNYFKIFIRNLKNSPAYMLINILGLSVGMAASILIFLFVQHELSYDTYHANADNIYRISRAWFNPDGEENLHLGHLAPPFGPLLKSDFEVSVQEAVRILRTEVILKEGEKIFTEPRFFFSDPEVFKVFSWKVLAGDADKALTFPDGLVISQSMANKYFGTEEVLGKSLEVMIGSFAFDMQIRGVFEDMPDNSHFKADFFATMEPVVGYYGGYEAMMSNFGSNNFGTYILLDPQVDPKEFEAQIPAFIDRHIPPNSQGFSASMGTSLFLWPLTDIHLYSNLDSEMEPNSSIEYVYIYAAIAIFILLIACVNFMNLATARSAKRGLEVGLRKVLGADRSLLIKQFMGETILMSFLALLFALLLARIALPSFNNFSAKDLSLNLILHPEYLLGIVALMLLVGIIAGSYPALFLSGFQPVSVLKGTYKIGSIHEKFRSILVIGQFAISITLIVAVIVVLNQLDFMKNKDLGFEKSGIVVLPSYDEFSGNYEMLRERFLQHRAIEEVTIGSRIPSGRLLDAQGANAEVRGELLPIEVRIADVHVSHSFIETFEMPLVAGRDFDIDQSKDSTESFILNEAAVRAIGWATPEEAIEKQFNYGIRRGYVIGVVKDFHFESLHQPISPMVFLIADDRINEVAVKINNEYKEEALAYLRDEWLEMKPEFPFNYYMVSDKFDQQYEAEEKVGIVFGSFAGLAVLISALGLFGLSAYATEQRTKEIGIRKVMGASIWNVVSLLGKDFLKLVLYGFVLAVPIAWMGMNQWLESFAYSISVSWVVFILAGVVATLIAAVTVSSQSIRAAMINPVDAFKE